MSGLSPQRSPIVAVMSTVGRMAVMDLQRSFRPFGMRFLDAPISGGSVRAEAGTLAMMVGGDDCDVEEVRPVLECLGTHVFHCGPVGAAQTIKVINNIIGGINTLMTAETYRLALEYGMSLSEITCVLDVSTGRNWLSADSREVGVSFAEWTSERRRFDSLMTIMHKDFDLARELLPDSKGGYPVVEALMSILDLLGEETFENWREIGHRAGGLSGQP